MLIEREHYLHLLNTNQLLQNDRDALAQENIRLRQQLQLQKTANQQLQLTIERVVQEHKQQQETATAHRNYIQTDIKDTILKAEERQNKLLEEKMQQLEGSSWQKCKVLEMRNTANRIQNHQLLEFSSKLKKIYKQQEGNAVEPSLKDVIKWVKSLRKENKSKMEDTSGSSFNKEKTKK